MSGVLIVIGAMALLIFGPKVSVMLHRWNEARASEKCRKVQRAAIEAKRHHSREWNPDLDWGLE